MSIEAIGIKGIASQLQNIGSEMETNADGGFLKALERQIASTNTLLNDADKAGADIAIGKSENLHSAMISMEKAETSLRFLTQVRNKALEAYNDILRMQI